MGIPQAVVIGVAANKVSKHIAGTSERSLGRTVLATGAGAAMGGVASGALVVAGAAAGVALAPVAVPLAVATAVVAGIASCFD